jgi:hypothetical protein
VLRRANEKFYKGLQCCGCPHLTISLSSLIECSLKGDISISNGMHALRQCSVLGAAMDAIGRGGFVSIAWNSFSTCRHPTRRRRVQSPIFEIAIEFRDLKLQDRTRFMNCISEIREKSEALHARNLVYACGCTRDQVRGFVNRDCRIRYAPIINKVIASE